MAEPGGSTSSDPPGRSINRLGSMELHQFFLYLAIILITARLFSEIAGRYGIPSVIGELLAGLDPGVR